MLIGIFVFFKQETAYEMRISDWSSDVCSSDLPTLLRRLVPSSLAGQIILVVAIALFVAQSINFTLLLRERERQRLTVATAPAVARIIDAIERRSGNPAHSFGGGPAQERLAFTDRMPNHEGKRRGDIESRAGALLAEADITVHSIRAIEQPRRHDRRPRWSASAKDRKSTRLNSSH